MPLAQPYQDVDPARALVVRALRWWWLGIVITVLIGAGYFLSSSNSASSSPRASGRIWANNPPALAGLPSFVPEVVSRMSASGEVPDDASIMQSPDHIDLTVTGSSDEASANDYATVVDQFRTTFSDLVGAQMTKEVSRAEAMRDAAKARSDELTTLYEDLPAGNTELAALYLARITAADDVVAMHEASIADLQQQIASVDVRDEPMATSDVTVEASSGGKFDLLVGLMFGAMAAAAVMLGLASFDKRVRSAVNLSSEVLGDVPVVECSPDSYSTDALIVAACTPEAGDQVRVVVLTTSAATPEPIAGALRRRHGDVDTISVPESELASLPDDIPAALQGAHCVVLAVRGQATERATEQLITLARACSAGVSVVALVPQNA